MGEPMRARSAFAIFVLWSHLPGIAGAGTTTGLPEPGVLELLAIAAAVGVAVAIRKRRK